MTGPKTVLVIDDDLHIRRIIELGLSRSGYRVLTASDGAKGLELLYTMKPDAVVTDLNMPKLDGEALCKETNPLKKEIASLKQVVCVIALIKPK